MNFLEKHKALLITLLISGTLILGMFSIHIKRSTEFFSETFYEIEPQTIEELKALESHLAENKNLGTKTNEAFNEDKAFKEIMRNFKTVTDEDYQETMESEKLASEESVNPILTSSSNTSENRNYAIADSELRTYNKAKSILDQQSFKTGSESSNNQNSSVTFSLHDREKISLPPPVYLCEENGKIVVNITVSSDGLVTDTYINNNSSSSNQCLIDHALEYAKIAVFTADASKKSQIGSITYYFKGKN